MSRRVYAAVVTALGLLAGTSGGPSASAAPGTARCPLPMFGPGRTYRPAIEPGDFSANVTNRWSPFPVGRTYVYTGVKDRMSVVDIVVASPRTRVVDGVRTRIVEDRLYENGVLEERTSDYYAQDRCGNVWYFGEDTAELDRRGNVVSTEGSFHAGVDGAQPGVFMQAHPQVGRRFRQEWYAGQAEDTFRVVDLSTRVSVPFGTFGHALRTEERTALEPGVVDAKYYVAGVGVVFEGSLSGPREITRLVEILP
ncbi:MAG: hypothetical protein ACJ71T_09970 [Actinomycetales bacterium]